MYRTACRVRRFAVMVRQTFTDFQASASGVWQLWLREEGSTRGTAQCWLSGVSYCNRTNGLSHSQSAAEYKLNLFLKFSELCIHGTDHLADHGDDHLLNFAMQPHIDLGSLKSAAA